MRNRRWRHWGSRRVVDRGNESHAKSRRREEIHMRRTPLRGFAPPREAFCFAESSRRGVSRGQRRSSCQSCASCRNLQCLFRASRLRTGVANDPPPFASWRLCVSKKTEAQPRPLCPLSGCTHVSSRELRGRLPGGWRKAFPTADWSKHPPPPVRRHLPPDSRLVGGNVDRLQPPASRSPCQWRWWRRGVCNDQGDLIKFGL